MNWKTLRVALAGLAVLATVGCGGLNGSYTVSPASFLLPGLGKATPKAPVTESSTNTFVALQAD